MKHLDFTKTGGFPLEQDTLDFMQKAYKEEILQAFLAHLDIPATGNYIIHGLQFNPANNTYGKGWVVIDNELLFVNAGSGTHIAITVQQTTITYEDNGTHPNYFNRVGTLTNTATNNYDINTFTRRYLNTDFLDKYTVIDASLLPIANQLETNQGVIDNKLLTPKKLNDRNALENQKGIAEIATQTETNAGTDDTRIVTPKKLHEKTNQIFYQERRMFGQYTTSGVICNFNNIPIPAHVSMYHPLFTVRLSNGLASVIQSLSFACNIIGGGYYSNYVKFRFKGLDPVPSNVPYIFITLYCLKIS